MSKNEIGSIPQIAKEFFNRLPKEMDEDLKRLVARAEEGHDTTIEIIDLLSKHEISRRWMREQIDLQSGKRDTIRGFVPLAGNSSLIPTFNRWVCPNTGCVEFLPVVKEGEDPPICSIHRVEMVRSDKE